MIVGNRSSLKLAFNLEEFRSIQCVYEFNMIQTKTVDMRYGMSGKSGGMISMKFDTAKCNIHEPCSCCRFACFHMDMIHAA